MEAWRKKADASLWSFSSGAPLVSFRWFSRETAREVREGDEEEEDDDEPVDGEWYVDVPQLPFESDGSLSVRDSLNRRKVSV